MKSKNRKVLIVSASIGAGHNQVAMAIKVAWEMKCPVDQVHIVDFMDSDNSYLNYLLKETYLKMITVSPDLYKNLYYWTQGSYGMKVQTLLSWIMQKSMENLIEQYQPDVIICTHPFPCGAAAYLKRKEKMNAPLVGVITDFGIHQMWMYPEIDQYIVATTEMKSELIAQGIPPSLIHETGIPIHPCFASSSNADELSQLLKLDKTQPILLLMGGGLGLGSIRDLLIHLDHSSFPLQIIAVTGSNRELREDLEVMAMQSVHTMHIFGNTRHIRELMQLSDILITKPGAVTICEALAMELPMLFFEPIPGQEVDNAAYIVNRGAARWISNCKISSLDSRNAIDNQISRLFGNRNELVTMQAAARLIRQPQSAYDAVRIISQLANEYIRTQNGAPPTMAGEKYMMGMLGRAKIF